MAQRKFQENRLSHWDGTHVSVATSSQLLHNTGFHGTSDTDKTRELQKESLITRNDNNEHWARHCSTSLVNVRVVWLKGMHSPARMGNHHWYETQLFGVYSGGGQVPMYLSLTPSVCTILTIYIKYNSALLKADSHRSKSTGLVLFSQRRSSRPPYGTPAGQHRPYGTLLFKAFERIWGMRGHDTTPHCFPLLHL